MKKLLTILLLSAMSVGAVNSYGMPVKHHHKYFKARKRHKAVVHLKKDGTPDRRYKTH